MSHSWRYELNLAAVGAFDCAATHTWLCSGVFPTVAWWRICDAGTSSRRRLDSLVFGRLAYIAAPRPHFDCLACMVRLAAFWISGIHARALAAFGRLTFVGCFDAGCRAFRFAVSAPWCQKMPQGGPIAARYLLRKEQSGVRDGSHHDKSAGHSCVVAQGFDFIRRWRGPLLAFSASKAVIFCNRAPLRHFPTSSHVTRSA